MADGPKSAFELAMEKLERQDRDRGEARRTLTDAQKQAIADARQDAQAKLAELDILKGQRIAECGGDPQAILETNAKIEIDRKRIDETLESTIRRIKEQDA